jgi:glycosyltransferase involved in cell wall biosynthesis
LLSISRQNESFEAFREFGSALLPADTFETELGAVLQAWRIPLLRRSLRTRLRQNKVQAVIELMPHVWSRLVAPVFREAGARYAQVVHDAEPHPGDRTSTVNRWLDASTSLADVVITLSAATAGTLAAKGRVPRSRIFPLFHPDLRYGSPVEPRPLRRGEPLRLIFLGRIMPYKGLPLLLDAVDSLHEMGVAVELGVFGEGRLGASAARLDAMGAEVVNRWLTAEEIGTILPRFHVAVLSHVEASQSGVAAATLGMGLPVVATPVGGLVEQITDGITGVIARRADAGALAEAIARLVDPEFYVAVCRTIALTHQERSMERFVRAAVDRAIYA